MKKQRVEMTPEELADDIFSHLSAGDFTEFETERLIEEIFTAGYRAGYQAAKPEVISQANLQRASKWFFYRSPWAAWIKRSGK